MNIYELVHAFNPYYMVLVNLYWLMFLVPGYAVWRFLQAKYMLHCNDGLVAGFVYSFFYASLLLLPFNILQFLVNIPSILVALYFLLVLVSGLYYLAKTSDFILKPKAIIANILARKNPLGIFLTAGFTLYYLIGQIVKAFALYEFDAWMHISKINYMMLNGLSNIDPYLLEPGKQIIQSNFFSNLVHSLFLVPAKILSFVNVGTPFIWYYSISFFSLFSYGVVYLFVKKLTENRGLSVFITLLYFFSSFATQNQWLVQYPTRMAFLFSLIVFTFIIDFVWKEKSRLLTSNYYVLAAGLLAISFLHQVMAALVALFVLGLVTITLVFREIDWKKAALLAATTLLVLPTAIYTKINSTFMPTSVFKLADSDDWIIRLSSKFSMTKFPDQGLTAVMLITIIGIILLSLVIKNRQSRLFIIYSVLFTNLLLYSPIFGFVNMFIPTWGIVRIDYYVALLNWMLVGISLWAVLEYVYKQSKPDLTTKIWTYAGVIFLLCLPAQKDIKLFYDVASWNQGSYLYVRELSKWQPLIEPHSVILTDKSLSFSIPGLYNAYAAVLDNERTTDSIDTTERANDLIDFLYSKKPIPVKKQLLTKYGVRYIIVRKKDQESFHDAEATALGFGLKATQADYKLYEKK